jgi:hypothetical protein
VAPDEMWEERRRKEEAAWRKTSVRLNLSQALGLLTCAIALLSCGPLFFGYPGTGPTCPCGLGVVGLLTGVGGLVAALGAYRSGFDRGRVWQCISWNVIGLGALAVLWLDLVD